MSYRVIKVNELIKQELGNILVREVSIPGVLVTIISVETSKDLRYSRALLSIFPEKKTGTTLKILKKEVYKIQKELDKRLFMRPVPKIRFTIDKSGEIFTKVNEAINDQ